MRLIDADAFIKMMEEKCDPESTLDPWVLSVCRGGVKIMPTVDAVPVQRCKDRIQQEIDELKKNGERHSDEVRQNGLLIAEGLRMALRIVEEIILKDGEQE